MLAGILTIIVYKLLLLPSLWGVFKDSGRNPYLVLVPFYGEWVWIRILKVKWHTHFVFLFFPFINVFIFWLLCVETSYGYKRRKILECLAASVFFFLYFPHLVFRNKEKYTCAKDLPPVKKSSAREWFDTIVFALVAVLIIHAFYFKGYVIPSSSMEKSLNVGDFLFVSKVAYGPRMPQTVLSFPFVQHTLPLTKDVPSYLTWLELPYHRMPGFRQVKHNDVIVFNFPDGDTVSSVFQSNISYNTLVKEVGRERVWRDKANFGRITYRPVDRRENFVKRCIGLPGDTLMLDRNLSEIQGEVLSPDSKALYAYPAVMEDTMQAVLASLGLDDNTLAGYTSDGNYIRSFSHYEYYLISQRLENRFSLLPMNRGNRRDVHPYVVPGKGRAVKVYPWNIKLLCNTILAHEHRAAEVKDGVLYVEGRRTDSFTFTKDYYWMVSNDPVNLCDSRLFGFVPDDHLIGKAWRIWYSSRENRFMRRIE